MTEHVAKQKTLRSKLRETEKFKCASHHCSNGITKEELSMRIAMLLSDIEVVINLLILHLHAPESILIRTECRNLLTISLTIFNWNYKESNIEHWKRIGDSSIKNIMKQKVTLKIARVLVNATTTS